MSPSPALNSVAMSVPGPPLKKSAPMPHYTMADTISELLVDSAGALAAALVALALRRSGDRIT